MPPRAFALFFVAPIVALAADDQPVQAPYVEVGDCWSYRGENIYNRGPIEDFEICVTFVNKLKDIIAAVATVKSDGREIDVTYSTSWGIYRSLSGMTSPQGMNFYKFPLHVGDAYSNEFEYRDAMSGANRGKVTWKFRVVGWEDVTVPAGTFHALKIEGQGIIQRYDLDSRIFPVMATAWYSPEVNRHVKNLFKYPDRQTGVELTAYRLNK